MEKHYTGVLCAGLLAIGLSTAAQAALVDNGGGFIYDDVLDVTWLQDANYADGKMTWDAAQTWVAGLAYKGFGGWRLPTIEPLDGEVYNMAYAEDGATDKGYNNSSMVSELGYMFYANLGYTSSADSFTYGSDENSIFGSSLKPASYWSGSEFSGSEAMYFDMSDGYQSKASETNQFYAWAVHDGNVAPVPIPAAVWLFGSALVGLMGFGRFRKQP